MFTIFTKLCSVFLMIGLGALARRFGLIDGAFTQRLSRLLTLLFYPALIYSSFVSNFSVSALLHKWTLPAGAFGIMALGFGIGRLVLLARPVEGAKPRASFLFQCTMNNYAFLPMPLALFYFGDTGLANLLFSTLGSEAALWTLGAHILSRSRIGLQSLRHLVSPPLLAIAASIGTIALRDTVFATSGAAVLRTPAFGSIISAFITSLDMLGGATIPVAMIVAGSRMAELTSEHIFSKVQMLVSCLRLLAIPAVALLLLALLPLQHDVKMILVLIAVMPAAVASVVMNEIYDGDPKFAASSVLATHLLAMITVPFWLAFWL